MKVRLERRGSETEREREIVGYCSSTVCYLTDCQLWRLQHYIVLDPKCCCKHCNRVNNFFFFKVCACLYRELHWLPIKPGIDFKLLSLTYNLHVFSRNCSSVCVSVRTRPIIQRPSYFRLPLQSRFTVPCFHDYTGSKKALWCPLDQILSSHPLE